LTPILSSRDVAKLKAVVEAHPGSETRVASVDEPASLDYAISGAAAVINCAGPFLDTAAPVIEAAIRARTHYLDVTAEQRAVLGTIERFSHTARDAGVDGFLFSRDGNKVYFTPYSKDPTEFNNGEMSEKDLVSGKISKITNFNIDKILNYTISRDGTKLYLVRGNRTDEVVLIRNLEREHRSAHRLKRP
jgi:hypothetical protein